jgi:hypothetical protein
MPEPMTMPARNALPSSSASIRHHSALRSLSEIFFFGEPGSA